MTDSWRMHTPEGGFFENSARSAHRKILRASGHGALLHPGCSGAWLSASSIYLCFYATEFSNVMVAMKSCSETLT